MSSSDVVRQALKLCTLPYAVAARQGAPGVTILNYHRVGGADPRQLNIPTDLFEWQMQFLHEHYRLIGLDDLLDMALPGVVPTRDVVAVTFDDGFEEVYTHAFPILQRLRIPATIYVATKFVDEGRPLHHSPSRANGDLGLPLTWPELQEMSSTGLITVGAHTHSHADLSVLPPVEIDREITQANRLIEDRLARTPIHFAYPWGRASYVARDVVSRVYRTAAVGGVRKNSYGAIDLQLLARTPVQRSDGHFFFQLKLSSWRVIDPSMWRGH